MLARSRGRLVLFYTLATAVLVTAFVVSTTMRMPDAIASIALCMIVWTVLGRILANWRLVIAGLIALFATCAIAFGALGLTVFFCFVALLLAVFHIEDRDAGNHQLT